MKVSINLAQYYSTVDLKSIDKTTLTQKVGMQLGAVEATADYAPQYQQVFIVKVMSCEKHPNADSLHVCRVDDGGVVENVERGDDGLVQVVCGAPNVQEGMFAVWIPPRSIVPSTWEDEEPFVLEARDLRGLTSNGMLASPKELGISDAHDGILEITLDDVGREPIAGEPLSDLFGLDDFIIDCENKMFTHRPDCFGNLGVARELAAINELSFVSPDWYRSVPSFESATDYDVEIRNDAPEVVSRFMAVVMKDIEVRPSPTWLQAALKRVDIKPINNVVDVSNFVMHLTGQPTHAFDFDKLQKFSNKPSLFPRHSKAGEKLVLLGNKEIELTGQEVVIATDTRPVALAGIMGGAETEVDEHTKSILIECATFDMYHVRKTSMRYGLFTDAVTRFSKGQSPLQNDRVLAFLMSELNRYAHAVQASEVYDIRSFDASLYDAQSLSGEIITSAQFINERLGSNLTSELITELLQRTEFMVTVGEDDGLIHIQAPFWRTDIEIEEDIVEEIGRLYGYEKLPVELPTRSSKPSLLNEHVELARKIRTRLKEAGANELLTYSFVNDSLLKSVGIEASGWSYHIRNALSPDLQYYRPSIMPSMLAKVYANIKAQAGSDDNEFALYEIGKVHLKGEYEQEESNLPKEMKRLALVYAADAKVARSRKGAPYYRAKKILEYCCADALTFVPLETNEYPITAPYQKGRSAIVMLDEQMLGVVGEFRASVRKALKLPDYCAGFEIDMDILRLHEHSHTYRMLSEYPHSVQDITLELPNTCNWQTIHTLLSNELKVLEAEQQYYGEIEPLQIFQADSSDKKRHSFRITITHPLKTLRTDEVNELMAILTKSAEESLGATRI
ncbi:MAG TPA: phenylalanine--tRNA ligase subunit beta [Candidatus Saccharibacteria bacterium]|nr:phenylalanine--tRNA ligase subunit beta [Candidatus Saccharibacteria bacterium]